MYFEYMQNLSRFYWFWLKIDQSLFEEEADLHSSNALSFLYLRFEKKSVNLEFKWNWQIV